MKQMIMSIFLVLAATGQTVAAEKYEILIKNHRFEPVELTIPAGKKIKLVVTNLDATPEEFESYALNREKIIRGKGSAVVFIGPLKPGRYKYFGEFNKDTAQGVIVAK
ncbi:MAG: cupredoxin domain-containing protein [Gammaproteobacteria bacterium]|nr:MAG: cupredoxin domain-containing protein [Gammaproteobacteria bacterium]